MDNKKQEEDHDSAWNTVFWTNTIRTIAALICFTTLAIVFRLWWISLFSVLFLSSTSVKS